MTVVDVNTGKFVGSGGNLEETVTKNNIEAAEEIVRQLRLRDIGGIIVVDFIDMVLESNRDLVVRRLLECLGRDRTKHQVAEVTSLGLVQMTRKRVGSGLIEVFSETCEHCNGRGFIIHTDPVDRGANEPEAQPDPSGGNGRRRGGRAPHPGQRHRWLHRWLHRRPRTRRRRADPADGTDGGADRGRRPRRGPQDRCGRRRRDPPAGLPGRHRPLGRQDAPLADPRTRRQTRGPGRHDGHDDTAQPVVVTEPPSADEAPAGDTPVDDAPAEPTYEPEPTDAATTSSPSPRSPRRSAPRSRQRSRGRQGSPLRSRLRPRRRRVRRQVESEVEATPAPRGRRRRGRVVAPAGPPRAGGVDA